MKISQPVTRLTPVIKRYVSLKRSLGRGFRNESYVLDSLDGFLVRQSSGEQVPDLTPELFAAWCHTQQHLASTVRRNRMRIARNLCLYRRRTEPMCFVPDKDLFPGKHQSVLPYIFTVDDIRRLIAAAQGLRPTGPSPLRAQNMRMAVLLLFTTGIRRGELVRLTLSDYDENEKTLLIQASKFHKSRVIPLSSSTATDLDSFLVERRSAGAPATPSSPLLWNRYDRGRGYTGAGLAQGLRGLFRQVGVHRRDGRLPRIHDLRHAFAANALLRWYRAGVDVSAKLPFLATYMGHVSVVSTQHYIQFVDELAAHASVRFERSCGPSVCPDSHRHRNRP